MVLSILIFYGALMLFIFLYSLSQLAILRRYLLSQNQEKEDLGLPVVLLPVTIQLPVYNEYFVAERLLDNIARMDYPRELLEIQVLDDSTDETTGLLENRVGYWREKGVDMVLLHRDNRKGFKAGALQYGLEKARGELIAVFDADFMPEPSFLKAVVPVFIDEQIGMVQTRWGHLNRDYNILTKLQAFGLDAHFVLEQAGRNAGGHFINFNGTGGVWRRQCIHDAGGWSADTLTEDLDLSYRAQLKNWKFKYLSDVVCRAELPVNINPLKSQQFRWTKGAAECLKKNLLHVLRADIPLSTRIHAFFHLSNSFVFVAVFLTALLSFPLLYIKLHNPGYKNFFVAGGLLFISLIILFVYYLQAYRKTRPVNESAWNYLWYFPAFLSVSMGISLHNAMAVAEGYLGIRTPFVRTPKFNAVGKQSDQQSLSMYVRSAIRPGVFVELLLSFYFLCAIFYGAKNGEFSLIPYHLMLFLGFGFVSVSAIKYSLCAEKVSV